VKLGKKPPATEPTEEARKGAMLINRRREGVMTGDFAID
jgi:hypothetical protein